MLLHQCRHVPEYSVDAVLWCVAGHQMPSACGCHRAPLSDLTTSQAQLLAAM
jgi:hypothetical protein